MIREWIGIPALVTCLALAGSVVAKGQNGAVGQAGPTAPPSNVLAHELAERVARELHGKTAVGQPIQAGTVTLIPILSVELNFAGGSAGEKGLDGFLMSGEARPLGFVVVSKRRAHFVALPEKREAQ